MARRVSRRSQNELIVHKLWFNIVAAIVILLIGYGFASWAINTGNLLLYAITLFCLTLAVRRVELGIRYSTNR
ncbi:MAG TPA: hypothetical protein VFT49_03020 [Candidatus Saccharimonadales bacterium]|nr:hypothetical protein [Candidatus Saccharimonadales bacterium]